MNDRNRRLSRRKFLAQAAALTLTTGVTTSGEGETAPATPLVRARPAKLSTTGRKPIAVVTTVYRPMSHAYHIAGRFIHGYAKDGRHHVPNHFVQSMYVDQYPTNDLAIGTARTYNIRLARTIDDALTDGHGNLAVEGVLLIGEHGNYPRNERGQILYPRYEMMEQIVSVFRKTGKVVPVFNDKHLSHSGEKSKQMFEWTQELRIPFLAGSSLPVVWRRPELELPLSTPLEDVLIAAYGPNEVRGFHALEALQVMAERRTGGESGVKAVTCLTGNEVWKAGDAGRWSWELLEAALSRSETLNPGDVRCNMGSLPTSAFLIEYQGGLRGTVLLLNGHIQDFCFAAKVTGVPKPVSCLFYMPQPPGAKFFDCQVRHIETLLENRRAPYPAERTLLTSGVLAAVMESAHRGGARVETPEWDIRYEAPIDSGFCRGGVAMCDED